MQISIKFGKDKESAPVKRRKKSLIDQLDSVSLSENQTNWALPWQLTTSTLYALCFMTLTALLYLLWLIFNIFSEVTIPLAIAILFTAILWPLVEYATGKGVPRVIASGMSLLIFIGLISGLFSLVGAQLANQMPALIDNAQSGFTLIPQWFKSTHIPFLDSIDTQMINEKLQELFTTIASSAAYFARTIGSGVTHFATGVVLALFATFFFLYDGSKLLRSSGAWLRPAVRKQLSTAAAKGWLSLTHYVRAMVIVAAVDGIFVGIGAAILGSHFAFSIGVLTFLMAFIPLLGALLSGVIATLVVMVTLGFWKAVIMLVIYVIVNQLEGNVLHPFLLGKSVDLHPLVVLIGIAVGFTTDGVIGALFIVPLMAFMFAFMKTLAHTKAEDIQR